jgi:hypothetical protein
MDGHRPFFDRSIRLVFAALGALGFVCLAGAEQMTTTIVPIDKLNTGAPPPEFDFARTGQGPPGRWTVVSDATAAAGRAIEQSSTDATDYRFPLAIYRPVTTRNVDITVRFKAVAGRVDQAGGIAVRLTGPNDYYVVRANALEDNVRFYRMVKGRREQLEGSNLKVAAGQWHTLGLKAEGARFTVTFNGNVLFTANDRTFAEPGRVALWTKADSVTRFDRFEIRTLP